MTSTQQALAPLFLAAAALAPASAAHAQPDADVTLVEYTVKDGDTCIGIAIRELGDRTAYRLIHEYNPRLGPLPHVLRAGDKLRLPARDTGADAELTGKRGPVRVLEPTNPEWNPARRGMDLFRLWRVNSRRRASAEVTFRDDSKVRLRENTVIIIYGPSVRAGKRLTSRAELRSGALRTRLQALEGGVPAMVVDTPSAEAELEPGDALVTVDQGATSRVANHGGAPATVRGKGKHRARRVRVAKGYGSKVIKDAPPAPPVPLPPTPAWAQTAASFVAIGRHSAVVLAWNAVPQAAAYWVEIVRVPDTAAGAPAAPGDGGDLGDLGDLIAAAEVSAPVTELSVPGLPAGGYCARVAAIDADAFEGIPTACRPFRVHGLALRAPGASGSASQAAPLGDDELLPEQPPPAPAVVVGTRVTAPDGMTCSDGAAPAAASFAIRATGDARIACTSSEGAVPPLPVRVAAITARLSPARSSSAGDASGTPPLPRGQTTEVTIALSADVTVAPGGSTGVPAALPLLVTTDAPGVTVGDVTRDGDTVRVSITPGEDAPEAIALRVAVAGADAPGQPGQPVELSVLSLAVAPAEVTATAPLAPLRARVELGAFGGGGSFGADHALGAPADPAFALGAEAIFGVRATMFLHPRVAAEGELSFGRASFADADGGATLLGGRFQGLISLFPFDRGRVFAAVGAGLHSVTAGEAEVTNESRPDVHYGLGAAVQLSGRVLLRVDARHIVGTGEGGATHLFEVLAGASAAFSID